jgi:hypothetical protein
MTREMHIREKKTFIDFIDDDVKIAVGIRGCDGVQ